MFNVKEIFKTYENEEGWFSTPSYGEIVGLFGSVELEVSDNDYQGDIFYLIKNGERYGYLSLSYGSCSSCDALQGCNNYDDLQKLVNSCETSVIWHDSFDEMKEWVKQRDWELTIEYSTGGKEFLKSFREYPLRAFK